MTASNIDALLAERGRTHGDYAEHAYITQRLKDVMRACPGWARLSDVQKETMEMISHKVGRVLAGDPNVADHWDDISGYARLVSQRLPQPTAGGNTVNELSTGP